MATHSRAPLFALFCLACASPAERDAGTAGDAGTPPDAAAIPDAGPACPSADTVCPAYVPPPGLACVGDLSCTFPNYEAVCEEGAWSLTQLCARCPWPASERCDEPDAGPFPGATIAIGPPGEARPFEDEELVDAVWGPQGSPMVAFAVELGVPEPPLCATLSGTIDEDGLVRPLGQRAVRLYCGRTRAIYVELAMSPCEPGDRPFRVTLQVEGVEGEVTALVRVRGDACG